MQKISIHNQEHPDYASFEELYATSFPIFEQRTKIQQHRAFSSSQYHLTAFKDDHTFLGFISYWEFESYIYVEHFAINQTLRGRGYGGEILDNFIADNPKIILLEIDPITDDVSSARLKFYKQHQFHQNPFKHVHPPYRPPYPGHSLIVLTTAREISTAEYDRFSEDLAAKIMKE